MNITGARVRPAPLAQPGHACEVIMVARRPIDSPKAACASPKATMLGMAQHVRWAPWVSQAKRYTAWFPQAWDLPHAWGL
jgi:hypothetical protein